MTSNTPEQQWAAKQKRLDSLKPAVAAFTICDDPDLRQRLADAKASAEDAETLLRNLTAEDEPSRPLAEQRAERARAELAAAQQAFDKRAVALRFTAIPRKDLEDLQSKHPASEQEEADGADFAMDTFAPALISAASLDGMPVDYARHCLDTWSAADARDLWNAAWGIQHTRRTDLGKG
jgi:hypothetical protein